MTVTKQRKPDLAYVERTRANLDTFEVYLRGELPDEDCEWCGGVKSLRWMPYREPVTFINGVSWGRWVCQWFGSCEMAPG